MSNHLLPSDRDWPEDKTLVARLSNLTADVTRYVLRYFDADAGQAEPMSTEEEQALGTRLIELGEALQARAMRRAALTNNHHEIIEGEAVQPPALEPDSEPDTEQP